MKVSTWAAGIINGVCIIILLLLTAVQIPTFGISFYEKEYEKNETYEQINILPQDLKKVTLHMLDYLRGAEGSLNIETTVAGEKRLFYSDRELSHMEDVKNLFSVGFLIRNISLILFFLTLCFLIFSNPEWLTTILRIWTIISGSVLGLIWTFGIMIAKNFDQAFTIFHKIFFNNDLWILDPEIDLLVNIVPTQFFIDIAVYIGLIFSFALVVLFLVSAIFCKRLVNKKYIRRDINATDTCKTRRNTVH